MMQSLTRGTGTISVLVAAPPRKETEQLELLAWLAALQYVAIFNFHREEQPCL